MAFSAFAPNASPPRHDAEPAPSAIIAPVTYKPPPQEKQASNESLSTPLGLSAVNELGQSTNAASAPRPAPVSARVLAVDDQRDSLRLLQIRLKNAGFECFSFSDGPAALDFLSREMVDIIITDVMMPGMDGFGLCERIKANARTADIPVLFLTANTEMDDKLRGLEVGGHDYLNKPVDQQELVARTRAALRVKQLQDELKKKLELQQQINRLHQGMLGEHWQKTLGQLAASLAHEINNPLAVAVGSIQLLGLEQGLSSDVHTRLQVIDQSLQRAAKKLRSLLLIAQNKHDRQVIHLGRLVEDLLALINYRVVIQKVHVQTRIHNHCDWHGAAADLGRALLNIIDNAIEAVSDTPNASLTIAVERCGPDCCIRVVDNGPGISPEAHARLFEPFFTTKGTPHSGIGLYLAEDIVRRAGGRIECTRLESPGGTEFAVYLPAADRTDSDAVV